MNRARRARKKYNTLIARCARAACGMTKAQEKKRIAEIKVIAKVENKKRSETYRAA